MSSSLYVLPELVTMVLPQERHRKTTGYLKTKAIKFISSFFFSPQNLVFHTVLAQVPLSKKPAEDFGVI